MKFPTINIKYFDSEPDSFECAINKNDTLSDVQKVNYLKNLVECKASTIISNIKLANENYKICLSLQREIRRQTTIHSHMCKLLKIENILA